MKKVLILFQYFLVIARLVLKSMLADIIQVDFVHWQMAAGNVMSFMVVIITYAPNAFPIVKGL